MVNWKNSSGTQYVEMKKWCKYTLEDVLSDKLNRTSHHLITEVTDHNLSKTCYNKLLSMFVIEFFVSPVSYSVEN